MPVASLVILSCGNPSRGDDALGPALHQRLEQSLAAAVPPPDVALVTDFQLQIEHALDLVDRDLVLFVDASVSCASPYVFSPLQAARDPTYTTHAMSPAAVLRVYAHTLGALPPPAFVLAIRGERFELGAALSPAALRNLEAAHDFVSRLMADIDPSRWVRQINCAVAPTLRSG